MPAAAAILPFVPAALSVVGGVLGLVGANKAASAQEKAANTARGDLMPYNEAGKTALTSLTSLLGLPGSTPGGKAAVDSSLEGWRNSPEYQFGLKQATDQTQASAAAKGFLQSPGTMEAVGNATQGYAGNFLDRYMNQLQTIANGGENAAAGTGDAALKAGEAKASGIVGGTNAIQGMLGNLQTASMLPRQSSYGTTSGSYLPDQVAPAGSAGYFLPPPGGGGSMTAGSVGGLY